MKVKEFKMPEGVELSETDQKGISALAGWMTENFNEFAKGQISEKEMIDSICSKLEESGFKGDTLKNIQESVRKQGETLTSLKEKALTGGIKMNGLKSLVFEKFDDFTKAVRSGDRNFSLKAIDEHNPDLIHTTQNVITSGSTAGVLEESYRFDPNLHLKRRDRQYIHDIANVSYVDEVPKVFTYDEEGDEEGFIAVVEENGLKPQVHLNIIENQVKAKKAAGYIVVTEEVIKWKKRTWAAIQRLFRNKVYRDFENLLTTDMLAFASSYIGTPLDGTFPATQVTDFHAIIAATLQLEQLNFVPDTLVINPADKWRLALSQTENGMFILPFIQQGGQFSLLGLRVITTNKVAAGTFLLGESDTWFIEEESPTLRTGLVNDDFIHNRMTIVGEIFFLSYVPSNNAGAWIEGNFDDIKEALSA